MVYRPTNEDVRVGSDQYDWRDPLDPLEYLREIEKYERICELVKEARTIIFGEEQHLDKLLDEVLSDCFFIAGDFVTGQAEYLATAAAKDLLQTALELEDHAAYHYLSAARIRDSVHFETLGKILAAPDQFLGTVNSKIADVAHAGARGLSWTARLFKFGNIGLTVISIGIDIYTGEPAEKIFLTTTGSLIGTAAFTAVVGAVLTTPPGWLLVTIGTIGGVTGGLAGSYLYDQTKPTPVIIDDNWAWRPS